MNSQNILGGFDLGQLGGELINPDLLANADASIGLKDVIEQMAAHQSAIAPPELDLSEVPLTPMSLGGPAAPNVINTGFQSRAFEPLTLSTGVDALTGVSQGQAPVSNAGVVLPSPPSALNGDEIGRVANTTNEAESPVLAEPETKALLWGIDQDDSQLFSITDYNDPLNTTTNYGTLSATLNGHDLELEQISGFTIDTDNQTAFIAINQYDGTLNVPLIGTIDLNAVTLEGPNEVSILGVVDLSDNNDSHATISGLDIDPTTGALYGVLKESGDDDLIRLDKQTGQIQENLLSIKNIHERADQAEDLVFDPLGNLYVVDAKDDELYRVDKTNAEILETVDNKVEQGLGNSHSSVKIEGLAWDSITNQLIFSEDSHETIGILSLENGNNQVIADLDPIHLTDIEGMDFQTINEVLPPAKPEEPDTPEGTYVLWGVDEDDSQLFSIGDYTDPLNTFVNYGSLFITVDGTAIDLERISSFAIDTDNQTAFISVNRDASPFHAPFIGTIDLSTAQVDGPNEVTVLGAVDLSANNDRNATIRGLAVDPVSGDLYGVLYERGDDDLIRINKQTGQIQENLRSIKNGKERVDQAEDLVFDQDGNLFVIDNKDDELYRVDKTNARILETVDSKVERGLGSRRQRVEVEGLAWDPVAERIVFTEERQDLLGILTPEKGNNQVIETLTSIGLTDVEGIDFQFIPADQAIRLVEDNNFTVTHEELLVIPETPSSLSFDYELNFDTTDPDFINDAFEVSLFDAQGNPLVPSFQFDRKAFINFTEGVAPSLGEGVTIEGQTVTLDLSGLAPGTEATLLFRLINDDADTTTEVIIRDIEFSSVSDVKKLSGIPDTDSKNTPTPVDFSGLEDVSASVKAEYGQTSFDPSRDRLYIDLAANNIGGYDVQNTLLVAVENVSDLSVLVQGFDGLTPDGIPYFDLSDLIDDGILSPDEITESRTIEFLNPEGNQFTYDLVFLSELNRAPNFVTEPETEALLGQVYTYDSDAIDPDNDALTYTLLTGPSELNLDLETGLITGTFDSVGTYSVSIQVEDDRGGVDTQTYTITVGDDLPNRPPLFTSTPVVDANINTLYLYDSDAVDADGDVLQYSLLNGPVGVTVDRETGLVEWTPSSGQIGRQTIELFVEDGRGGSATQRYEVLIQAEAGNIPPVIISNPFTQFNRPGSSNPFDGEVNPTVLDLDLDRGDFYTETLSLTLPTEETGDSLANVIFVVDESGSMSGEQNWIKQLVPNLDLALAEEGIEAQYGLVGFGGAGFRLRGHSYNVGDDLLGNVNEFLVATRNLALNGGTEDGYDGLDVALDYPFDPGAAVNVILVTDEDRDNVNGAVNFNTVLTDLTEDGALLNSVLNARFQDSNGRAALGVDAIGNAYTADGSGDFLDSEGGRYTSGAGRTKQDYVDLSWANGGAAWDLNQLRAGGLTAASFTEAFIEIKAQEIQNQLEIEVIASDPNIDFTNLTGTLSGIGDGEVANFDIEIVGDGVARSFDLLFVRPDSNIVLGSIPVTLNNDYRYPVKAIDADGDDLTFSLLTAPTDATIDAITGQIKWEPDSDGDYAFSVQVDDGRGGFDTQSYTVTVTSGVINVDPLITSTAPSEALINQLFTYQVTAEDLDGDFLSYYLDNAPEGMTIDRVSGTVRWVASSDQIGTQTVDVRVLDGRGGEAIQSFDLTAGLDLENSKPEFDSTPVTSVEVNQQYRYAANAGDPDGDQVSYDLALAPEGMIIDSTTGQIVWEPRSNQEGFHSVVVRAKDGRGGIDLQSFELTVGSPNIAPVLTSTPPTQASQNLPYQYRIQAQDADGSIASYRLDNAPLGMTLDPVTGILNWTPSIDQLGTTAVDLVVIDERGGETPQPFTIEVLETLPNEVPQILSTPRTVTQLQGLYTYQLVAEDPNGDPLSYAIADGPDGMVINDEGLLTWQPNQLGSNDITLQVDDGRGGVREQTFSLNVVSQSSNQLPEIISTPNSFNATVGQAYEYDLEAIDPDGDIVFWSLDQAPAGVSIDPEQGTLRWIPTADQVGTVEVAVRATDSQGGVTGQAFNLTVRGGNLGPQISSAPLTTGAVGSTYNYAVLAQDPEGDAIAFSLGTSPEGMTIDAETGLISWTPTATGNQDVTVEVRDSLGATSEQTFSIVVSETAANQAPAITSQPQFSATPGEAYSYTVTGVDPDGDALTYQLLDGPVGMAIAPDTGELSWIPTEAGTYTIAVGVVDPSGLGGAQQFTLTVADNTAPVILSVPLDTAAAGQIYRYDIRAQDPDGETVSYELRNAPDGMTIDNLGRIRWTPEAINAGVIAIEVVARDPRGAESIQSFNLTVSVDDVAPIARVVPSIQPVGLGESVTLFVSASDDVGVEQLTLTVNGEAVPLTANGLYTFTPEVTGEINAVVTATDAAGNSTQAESNFSVLDFTDASAPVIELPDLGDRIFTGPTDIIGTVSDDNLQSYTLSVAPLGTEDFTEVFSGTDPVTNGVLGTFDPTLLQNDSYTVRLTAEDFGGNLVSVDETVSVAGDLKLGNFQLSFTDLEIPVNGIPISVTRTYDTLTSKTQDDFGFGWRLEFRDTDLRTSLRQDETFDLFGLRRVGFDDRSRVYVTLPGGNRQAFTFTPTINRLSGFLGAVGAGIDADTNLYNPAFEADNGVTSTLSVRNPESSGNMLSRGEDGVFRNLAGQAYNPSDPYFGGIYVLTTKEGIEYEIDGETGDLLKVIDLNGNTLTYTDGGIFSDTGKAVTFERDAQNRITAVIDPAGNRVTYDYDNNNDLVAVSDREGNKTQFTYEEGQPHYLDEVIDPLNRALAKTSYNEKGQLETILDVNGNAVEFSYDPANSLQTVKDALGNATGYEYDQRGNVVSAIDALGNITQFTYDRDNNLLSQTDPLGNTTSYTYDEQGNATSKITATGDVTYYSYDNSGQLESLVLPTGASLSLDYDRLGNLLSVSDGDGNLINRYLYNSSGWIISETDAFGTITYHRDISGNIIQRVDPDGSITHIEYDALGQVSKMTNDDGSVSTFTYDKEGREIRADYGDGLYLDYTYTGAGADWTTIEGPTLGKIERKFNDEGQLAGWIAADGSEISYEYDAAGRLSREIDSTGQVTDYFYDAAGRLIRTHDAAKGAGGTREYDAVGRVIKQTDALGNAITNLYYPGDERLASVTDARGNTWTYSYDGNATTVTDPLGRQTVSTQSDYYLPTQTRYADGSVSSAEYLFNNNLQEASNYITRYVDNGGNDRQFTYDEFGRLVTATDLGDNVTTYHYGEDGLSSITGLTGVNRKYSYDDRGNLNSILYGDENAKQFNYDEENQLSQVMLASGETIDYTYDDAGRPASQTSSSGESITIVYTEDGSLATAMNQNGTTTYLYDTNGSLSGINAPNGINIRYERDLLGRVTRLIEKASPDSIEAITQYAYDEVGNLKSVIDPLGGETVMTYDAVNRLVLRELPNGVSSLYRYNDLDQIISLNHQDADGLVLASFVYERNGLGEPTKITREDGSYRILGYDDSLRLISEIYHNADGTVIEEMSYTYDAAGNRTAIQNGAGRDDYSYGPGFQLISIEGRGGIETYSHDLDGRLTEIIRDGEVLDLNHDAFDRLQQLDNQTTGEAIQYLYDGEGRRIGETDGTIERRYLVAPTMGTGLDVQDLIVDAQGNLLSNHVYVGATPLLRLDAEGNPVYYLTDAMGSVIELANGSGQTVAEYKYDGFGNILATSGIDPLGNVLGGDYRFQSQWLEAESGLYYFRARDYDSQTGRFISRDPVDIIEKEPESFNPYQFVYNNPYIYSDPTGEFTITELNASNKIQNILQTYVKEEAKDFIREKTGELFGNLAIGVINKLLPGTLNGDALATFSSLDPTTSGGLFEDFLQDNLCPILPNILSDRLWLTPEVRSNGKVENSGFHCGSNRSRDPNFSNPDFLFEEGSPNPVKRKNPQSYLIGDIKLTLSQAHDSLKLNKNQWQAIANHAEKYQAIPLTSYITFKWTVNRKFSRDPSYVATTLKDMQRIAAKNNVVLFSVNLFD